eukprot:scaffold218044_cov16-Tisochrysis_lutea.AAC.1
MLPWNGSLVVDAMPWIGPLGEMPDGMRRGASPVSPHQCADGGLWWTKSAIYAVGSLGQFFKEVVQSVPMHG